MPMLHVQLLGDFRLLDGDTPVTAIRQARQQSLLAYLLLHRGAPQPRQHIAFQFWPDTSEAQAQTNLRQLLHHLQRAWPDSANYVQIEARTLCWNVRMECAVDVEVFGTAATAAAAAVGQENAIVARAECVTAVELYRGDLLPACYEEWLLPERERLRQTFLEVLQQLVVLCENARDYPSAIHYAQRFLRADPLHETTYRRLMRLHALNGDPASALRTYHVCATLLDRELGVEPNQDTQDAYARLLKLEGPPADRVTQASSAARERLVGRQAEWAALQTQWAKARKGYPHLCCIVGEAGIGKSRLAEEMLHWVRQQGIAHAHTRTYAAGRALSYAPVTDWLRAHSFEEARRQLSEVWLIEAVRLLPEILVDRPDLPRPDPLTESWQRQRFFEALARIIMAANQPILLVLDDLQWCDQETLEWLPYLLRFDRNARLLIVGTLRPEEIDANHPLTALLLNLRATGYLTEIELGPLDIAETARLARQVSAHSIDAGYARHLYQATEGNPFFVVECMRTDAFSDVAPDEASLPMLENAALPSTRLPPTVHAIIRRRLAHLSPAALELASIAGVIGRSFTFNLLAETTSLTEDTLVRALDELWQRRIVRVQDATTYDFSHDQIRAVAYDDVSPVRQRRLHHQVAQALERLHRDGIDEVCGQVAAHYELAGKNDEALAYYRQAAAVANRLFACAESIAYMTKTLSILETSPPTPARNELKLDALLHLGQMLHIVKGFATPELDSIFQQARALALHSSHHGKLFSALEGLHVYWRQSCRWLITTALEADMLKIAEQTQDAAYKRNALRYKGVSLFHQGQFGSACDCFQHAIAEFDSQARSTTGAAHELSPNVTTLCRLAQTLLLLGYPARAHVHQDTAMALARQIARPLERVIAVEFAIWAAHDQRQYDELPRLLEEHSAIVDQYQFPEYVASNMMLRGFLLAHQGASGPGIELMTQGLAAWRAFGIQHFLPYVSSWLAEAYGWSDRFAEGLALLDELVIMVEQLGNEFWSAEILRLRGEFLLESGAPVMEAEEAYRNAIEVAHRQDARLLELRATVSLARLLAVQGRHAEATPLLAAIYAWFSEGFDCPDLQEARFLLARLSV